MAQAADVAIPALYLGSGVLGAGAAQQDAAAAAGAARYNAKLAEDEGAREAARIRREGVLHAARRRVAIAKSGFAVEGTPLAAMVADAETIERSALEAEQAAGATGRLERYRARTATRVGRQQSIGAVLGGILGAGASYLGATRPRLGGYGYGGGY